MEDINSKILQQGFGLKLLSSYRTRTGLLCRTDAGMAELKKTNVDNARLELGCAIGEHLTSNGFPNVDCFFMTKEGKPYYKTEDTGYMLIKYVQAHRLEIENTEDFIMMAKLLAKFHNAAQGFSYAGMDRHTGELIDIYKKRSRELARIKKWINSQSVYTPIDLIVVKNYEYYSMKTNEAIDLLMKADYEELSKNAEVQRTICHNAFKNDNVRITDSGELWVSGVSGCTCDISVIDLAELIRKYMKTEECRPEVISEAIEAYGSIRNISSKERELLKATLTYPNKFIKLCTEHYNKRRVCVSEISVQKLERCVGNRDREMRIVRYI